jgi:endonuclease/exonuclease/phosphatase family metal-dependent hydrolase
MAVAPAGQPGRCRTVSGLSSTPVAWLQPDAPRDRAALAQWCDTVGPIIVSNVRAAGAPVERLTVVTWNTHVGAGDLGRLVASLRQRTAGAGLVLLLQEARRTGLQEAAADLGLNLLYAPAMRNASGNDDRGNAILSDLRIDDVTIVELPFERQRRLTIVASVVSGTRRLRVANAHFENRASLARGSPASARARQSRALIEALANEHGPIVLGGDLNTSWGEDEPAIRDLRQAFPDGGRIDAPWTFAGPLGLRAPLDYLLARGLPAPIEVTMLPDRFGSDHHPLVTVVPW